MALLLRRNLHDSRKNRRHLYGSKFQFLFLSLFFVHSLLFRQLQIRFSANQSPDIQRFVSDQRERAGGIHGHGSDYRIDILLKVAIHIFFLFLT